MKYSRGPFTAVVDNITESEWNSLLEQFADASIYQTWAYGAVSWGERHLSHLVLLRDKAPVAIAQLRIVRVPLVTAGIAYLRWGPVCTPEGGSRDPAVWQAAIDALIEEYVNRRGLMLRVLPLLFSQDVMAPALTEICDRAGFAFEAGRYRTLRVDLSHGVEQLRSRLAHKWRNQLNAAERNDLQVEEGTDDALYDEFTRTYDEMMARKRFDTTVSVSDFRRIQRRLPASQKMCVLIARKAGRSVSGLVASSIGSMGIYLLGATGDEGMKAKGSYLLQWHLLRRLKANGCGSYDLGGINRDMNPGVYHFKKGLGGDEVSQVGQCDLHPNRLSQFVVRGSERIHGLVRRLSSVPGNISSRRELQ
jgi:hypothetical protein